MNGKSWFNKAATMNASLWSKKLQRQLFGQYVADWGMGNGSKRFADMRQIGGKVQIIGERFHATRKLFVARGKAQGLLYVKNARKRFEPLCVDGTLSSGRRWKDLEIPEDYRRTDGGVSDGGHVTVMNIVDATRERILGGKKPLVDWAQSLKGFVEKAKKP